MKIPKMPLLAAIVLIAFFLGGTVAQSAPTDSPVLGNPNGATLMERDNLNLVWTDTAGRGIWYQIYLQKNGTYYTSYWVRGDEVLTGTTAGMGYVSSHYQSELGEAQAGDYSFWVQAWEPCYGYSAWSNQGTFTVHCRTLVAPALNNPVGTFDRTWPNFYTNAGSNSAATWSEIEVYREAAFVGRQWLQKDSQGSSTIAQAQFITAFDPHYLDGSYTWKSRDYSPCGGMGPWSNPAAFDVTNTDCMAPPTPQPLFFSDAYHSPSDMASEGNHPLLGVSHGHNDPSTRPSSWTEVYLLNVTTGRVAMDEWVYWGNPHPNVPFLNPGTYYAYTRHYNRCGTGPWLLDPGMDADAMFTITSKDGAAITNLNFRGYDCEGRAYAGWDAQAGIDWYQLYVTCDGSVIANQWCDISDPSNAGPVFEDRDPSGYRKVYAKIEGPCAGRLDIWVRSYGNSGVMGDWTQLYPPPSSDYDQSSANWTSVTTSNYRTTFDWGKSTNMGQYEIYVQREGKLYFNGILPCEYVGPNAMGPGHPAMYSRPSEVTSYFQLCPGEYNVWVRSLLWGARYGSWSYSHPFTISND